MNHYYRTWLVELGLLETYDLKVNEVSGWIWKLKYGRDERY